MIKVYARLLLVKHILIISIIYYVQQGKGERPNVVLWDGSPVPLGRNSGKDTKMAANIYNFTEACLCLESMSFSLL